MTILLDIDGVLVTTPVWRAVELHGDGFMEFNGRAAKNLADILDETGADIILTSTHRISYSVEEWKVLLMTRGIKPTALAKINGLVALDAMRDRAAEIEAWVNGPGVGKNYVIIDDDLSINRLSSVIKNRFVLTKPMIGLDEAAALKALNILRNGFK
ncbi:HAD domain-containing protein [Hymenobacter caeli]|uniref:Phosphatase n=1 Tax=Hymenobacter caeli TaxID=2735894 RepID=A0ABX2FR60_9BACT|nr:HAD domain-containing protein [Hymenobacter caeli]NRT19663.1 hypothetical protein [Hymenobacter caeli]